MIKFLNTEEIEIYRFYSFLLHEKVVTDSQSHTPILSLVSTLTPDSISDKELEQIYSAFLSSLILEYESNFDIYEY